MTSDDRRIRRSAVFERDDWTCGHCGITPDGAGGPGGVAVSGEVNRLSVYAVDSMPVGEGGDWGGNGNGNEREHVSVTKDHPDASLVTVCESCLAIIERMSNTGDGGKHAQNDAPIDPHDCFETVHDLTVDQGEAIADIVAFADLGASLPDAIVDDETELTRTEYASARRANALTLAVLESRFETLNTIDTTALEPDSQTALEAFHETARQLQDDLWAVVETVEHIVAALDCCHVCLTPSDSSERCPTCSTARLEAESELADGTTLESDRELEDLYQSLSESLRTASGTTDRVTTRATAVAEELVGP